MNRLKCIKAFNFGKKNRELLCLKESPNLLRGAWRIRTAVDGFADRRLSHSSKAPLYFSGLTKLFAVFFQFTPVTRVGSALYHPENAQGSIANGDDKD